MKLQTVFDDLMYGELSKHGMSAEGVYSENDKAKLVHHINVALTELYTRFPLLTKEVAIEQKSGITQYHLNSKYAVSNTESTETKYIIDTFDKPFINDVIRVEQLYDEVGNEISLNDPSTCLVAFQPAVDILEIPNPVDTNMLFAIYRAQHPKVTTVTTDLLLPEHLKPALLAYVAYRVYSGGTAQEHVNLANIMQSKYELFCTQQREYGMTNQDDNAGNCKPHLGGWI